MADITNPQAVRFANETVRPLADAYASLYFAVKRAAAEFVAQDIGAVLPNTPDVIADGSAVDGRTPITGADVHALAGMIVGLAADLEANGSAKLNQLLRISVNAR